MDSSRLTAFTLAEQEDLNRSLIPSEGDPVLLYLLVNGITDGLGARFLSFSSEPLLRSFAFARKGTRYEGVVGGYDGGHNGGWW